MFHFLKKVFFTLILVVSTASSMLSLAAMQQDQTIEITLCEHADPQDCSKIYFGLESYNLEKRGPVDTFCLIIPECSDNQVIGSITGLGARICKMELIMKDSNPVKLYNTIQAQFKSKGAQTIEVNCSEEQLDIKDFLEKNGFTSCGDKLDLHTGKKQYYFVKQISNNDLSVDEVYNSPDMDWFNLDECTVNPDNFRGRFGVFIRDAGTQKILGGLYGTMHPDAAIPHSSIDFFWIDSAVRGTGLGKQVVTRAEDFAREQGLSIIELGTANHQAPWFYKKMGYEQVLRIPGGYDFQKSL